MRFQENPKESQTKKNFKEGIQEATIVNRFSSSHLIIEKVGAALNYALKRVISAVRAYRDVRQSAFLLHLPTVWDKIIFVYIEGRIRPDPGVHFPDTQI